VTRCASYGPAGLPEIFGLSARSERVHLVAGWWDIGRSMRQLCLRHRQRIESAFDPKRTSLGNCVKAKDALPIVLHANAAITAAFREVLWTRAEIMVFSSGWMHRSAERRLANLVSG
jgi:hypothetical protein